MLQLTDDDLRFVAETVEGDLRDPDDAPRRLRAREDLLEVLLEDDRLVERLLGDEHALLRVSPRFMFTVLLRRVVRDLRDRPYTLERSAAETVAVFDAPRVRRFIAEPAMWSYLVHLLTSFVRNEFVTRLRRAAATATCAAASTPRTSKTCWRSPGWRTATRCRGCPGGSRTSRCSRAGCSRTRSDGPGRAAARRCARGCCRPRSRRTRSTAGGSTAWRPSQPEPGADGRVLETLAEEFPTARKSLELLSDRYLRWTRLRLFDASGA